MMDVDAAIASRHQPAAETFVTGLPRPALLGEHVEARGIVGEVIEILNHKEWIDEWLAAGLPRSWVGRFTRYYVRCRRI